MAMESETTLEVEYRAKLADALKAWAEGSLKPEPKWTTNRSLDAYDFDFDENMDSWDGYDAESCMDQNNGENTHSDDDNGDDDNVMKANVARKGKPEVCMDQNNGNNTHSDDDDNGDDDNVMKVDEPKLDESELMDFATLDKPVTVRNRHDTADLMKANVARKDVIALTEVNQPASWGTRIPDGLVLDQVKLAEAVKKVIAEEDMQA